MSIDSCTICLRPKEGLVQLFHNDLSMAHSLHERCLAIWLERSLKAIPFPRCPQCTIPIKEITTSLTATPLTPAQFVFQVFGETHWKSQISNACKERNMEKVSDLLKNPPQLKKSSLNKTFLSYVLDVAQNEGTVDVISLVLRLRSSIFNL